jgi:alpha-L-fucosidase
LPWGDVTVRGRTLYLCVFTWPASGRLHLPGLKTEVTSATLLTRDGTEALSVSRAQDWLVLHVPARAPEELVSVVQLDLAEPPDADPTWGLDPEGPTEILAEFASVEGAKRMERRWMEKFGEWKRVSHVSEWNEGGKAVWEIAVLAAGDYHVDLEYAGRGRLVWGVDVEGGEHIQNEQNSSHNYQTFPIGWIRFPKPGSYRIAVSCLEGERTTASLTAIRLTPVDSPSPPSSKESLFPVILDS